MDGSELVKKLQTSTKYFRSVLSDAGFTLKVTDMYWSNVKLIFTTTTTILSKQKNLLVGYSESVAHVGRGASHCPSDAR